MFSLCSSGHVLLQVLKLLVINIFLCDNESKYFFKLSLYPFIMYIISQFMNYIEINTWPFPYQPGYHPETPISAETQSMDDSRDDMEKVVY